MDLTGEYHPRVNFLRAVEWLEKVETGSFKNLNIYEVYEMQESKVKVLRNKIEAMTNKKRIAMNKYNL